MLAVAEFLHVNFRFPVPFRLRIPLQRDCVRRRVYVVALDGQLVVQQCERARRRLAARAVVVVVLREAVVEENVAVILGVRGGRATECENRSEARGNQRARSANLKFYCKALSSSCAANRCCGGRQPLRSSHFVSPTLFILAEPRFQRTFSRDEPGATALSGSPGGARDGRVTQFAHPKHESLTVKFAMIILPKLST